MQQRRYLATFALCAALASGAWAADDCTSTSVFTIASQADADALVKCTEYAGDVFVSSDASGNITLDGLTTIRGRLAKATGGSTDSVSLTGITSETLKTVDGNLVIADFAGLQSIGLPGLVSVGGDVQIQRLPALVDLNLGAINSVGSLSLVSLPKVRSPNVGLGYLSEDTSKGLKFITSSTNAVVEIRDTGFEDVGGILNIWNASQLIIEDTPNLQSFLLLTGHVGDVRIRGNGNLTLHMAEEGWGIPVQPVIERLNITGVKHISPCLWPDVWDFIAINNTVEYLHFGFKAVRRLEIRENPNMRTLVPYNGNNLWEWNLTTMIVQDNPLLLLSQFPERPANDTLTLADCPYIFNHSTDQWQWYPFHMDTLIVDARIDDTFFFGERYFEAKTYDDKALPKVLGNFEVTSTNSSFSCTELDALRRGYGAFPGTYSCQGHTVDLASSTKSGGGARAGALLSSWSAWSVLLISVALSTAFSL